MTILIMTLLVKAILITFYTGDIIDNDITYHFLLINDFTFNGK